jgi:type VI protein secretion system component Hcp
MSTNEKIAEAELVVRKPGAAAQKPYVKITLKDARITAFDFESGVDAHGRPILNERVEFSFHGLEFVWTDGGRTANLDV